MTRWCADSADETGLAASPAVCDYCAAASSRRRRSDDGRLRGPGAAASADGPGAINGVKRRRPASGAGGCSGRFRKSQDRNETRDNNRKRSAVAEPLAGSDVVPPVVSMVTRRRLSFSIARVIGGSRKYFVIVLIRRFLLCDEESEEEEGERDGLGSGRGTSALGGRTPLESR